MTAVAAKATTADTTSAFGVLAVSFMPVNPGDPIAPASRKL